MAAAVRSLTLTRPAAATAHTPRAARIADINRCRAPLCVACTLLLALLLPAAGGAQRLHGRLLDLDSNEPLAFGVLTLLTPAGDRLSTVVTDERGSWTLRVPGPGAYRVEATRPGYEPWVAGPLEINADDDLNSVFHLRRRPIRLPTIEVTAQALRRHLQEAGFYARQEANFGHFMTPEDIEKRQAKRLTDLLLNVPGVTLVTMTTGSVGGRFVQLRGSNLSRGGICRPRVYVDGLLYALGDSRPVPRDPDDATEQRVEQLEQVDQGLNLDDVGSPSDIAAIEVYRSASQVPAQFGAGSVETLCGVIVIWMRRGFRVR